MRTWCGNRVGAILFETYEGGKDLYIDVFVTSTECYSSLIESAIQLGACEKTKFTKYKLEVETMPNCVFITFVVGSVGGFGPCATQI